MSDEAAVAAVLRLAQWTIERVIEDEQVIRHMVRMADIPGLVVTVTVERATEQDAAA